ncbi:oligopeptide/dipeptide ABC transporter, ATPase subunit [Desulforamulus reducens MI-1]|uniref:Oligopeptide/dipeptide ABC transporter, ATPase subunit n=1 Tax=Desulforamulus reducens (strain ATCC BAA-1160 / DSM 100696 / MI-1) TaxID=349161 RepID=A4J4U1_DESRM|nr:ABC transporter ATP-binding protein [Desulforamulus reducens]ABO50094.1 oligopeptide/dipeptide ABC transporter, ATPase subunit [Desulforamulus reducens MI-1]
MSNDILSIINLRTYFPVKTSQGKDVFVKAVDGVNLKVERGEVLGVVGESGSGKSTIAYTVMGMYKPTGGKILFHGQDISILSSKRPLLLKKDLQIVFQDPGSSLNIYQDIKQILELPLKVHKIVNKNQIKEKIISLLQMVELSESYLHKSPVAMGGGERQMVSIARALACEPRFIILDEPTSALDVSIQAKIINMLLKLQREKQLTYMFITHDLSLMRNIATRVAIMYLGKICEIAKTNEFFSKPLHPYTRMLLSSIPVVSEEEEAFKPKKIKSTGEIPSPVNIPSGCSFHLRCPERTELCYKEEPTTVEVVPGHFVRCHLYQGMKLQGEIAGIGDGY